MSAPLLKLLLALGAVVWFLACLLLYRGTRYAAWLAGSTVASCLGFLGLTGLASVLVPGALALLPLWLGIVVLTGWHLWAAAQRTAARRTLASSGQVSPAPTAALPRRPPAEPYI